MELDPPTSSSPPAAVPLGGGRTSRDDVGDWLGRWGTGVQDVLAALEVVLQAYAWRYALAEDEEAMVDNVGAWERPATYGASDSAIDYWRKARREAIDAARVAYKRVALPVAVGRPDAYAALLAKEQDDDPAGVAPAPFEGIMSAFGRPLFRGSVRLPLQLTEAVERVRDMTDADARRAAPSPAYFKWRDQVSAYRASALETTLGASPPPPSVARDGRRFSAILTGDGAIDADDYERRRWALDIIEQAVSRPQSDLTLTVDGDPDVHATLRLVFPGLARALVSDDIKEDEQLAALKAGSPWAMFRDLGVVRVDVHDVRGSYSETERAKHLALFVRALQRMMMRQPSPLLAHLQVVVATDKEETKKALETATRQHLRHTAWHDPSMAGVIDGKKAKAKATADDYQWSTPFAVAMYYAADAIRAAGSAMDARSKPITRDAAGRKRTGTLTDDERRARATRLAEDWYFGETPLQEALFLRQCILAHVSAGAKPKGRFFDDDERPGASHRALERRMRWFLAMPLRYYRSPPPRLPRPDALVPHAYWLDLNKDVFQRLWSLFGGVDTGAELVKESFRRAVAKRISDDYGPTTVQGEQVVALVALQQPTGWRRGPVADLAPIVYNLFLVDVGATLGICVVWSRPRVDAAAPGLRIIDKAVDYVATVEKAHLSRFPPDDEGRVYVMPPLVTYVPVVPEEKEAEEQEAAKPVTRGIWPYIYSFNARYAADDPPPPYQSNLFEGYLYIPYVRRSRSDAKNKGDREPPLDLGPTFVLANDGDVGGGGGRKRAPETAPSAPEGGGDVVEGPNAKRARPETCLVCGVVFTTTRPLAFCCGPCVNLHAAPLSAYI